MNQAAQADLLLKTRSLLNCIPPSPGLRGLIALLLVVSVCAGGAAVGAEDNEQPLSRSELPQLTLSPVEQGRVWDQAIHILGGNANVISRWVGEVRYSLVGDAHLAPLVASTLAQIGSITGLVVRSAAPQYEDPQRYADALAQMNDGGLMPCVVVTECANFVVIVAGVNQMKEIASTIGLRRVYRRALDDEKKVLCFFAPYQSASTIRQALVFVRSDQPKAMLHTCILEEIYQSFGLFNDYSDSEYFSFNNRVEPKAITPYDQHLLQVVYQFSPGAPAFAVVKQLMKNLNFSQANR